MILVKASPNFCIEKKYVLNVIFNEFLGIDYVFERLENFDKIELWLPNNACITLASSWWDTIDGSYISKKSLPGSIGLCSNDYMSEDDIPLLFGSGITLDLLVQRFIAISMCSRRVS